MALPWLPLHWIAEPPQRGLNTPSAAPGQSNPGLVQRLALPPAGVGGNHPLPWWAAASYAGALRHELLQLRQMAGTPHWQGRLDRLLAACLPGLSEGLSTGLAGLVQAPLLVPIPSWKSRANPLPGQFSQQLGLQLGWRINASLLRRSRPVLGQHHLGRQLRWANQADAFVCPEKPSQRSGPRCPLLLVDDILTTGATLLGAAAALQMQGWRVIGACCLARTPAKRGQRP